MTLGELIIALEELDPDTVFVDGFSTPHSWRGDYSELAFEPEFNVTAGSMLMHARSAVKKTFEGYKGGEYTMS